MRLKKVIFNPFFFVLFAIFYIAGRVDVYLCCILCAAIHEGGHILAAKICNADISSVGFSGYGMNISLQNEQYTSYLQDIFIALSGPFFNLLAAICAMPFIYRSNFMECFAGINLILFLLNLLLVSVLDGGRAFYAFLCFFTDPYRAKKAIAATSVCFTILLIGAGIVILVKTRYNISLLVIGIWLMLELMKQKVENPLSLL